MDRKRILKISILIVFGLLIINLFLIGYFLFSQNRNEIKENLTESNLKVIFLDIGQGDASLIQTPNGHNILIDGGPDRGIIYKLDKYISIINRKIDLMILTHPDPDHLNGLIEVVKRYPVSQIFYTGVRDPDESYKTWQNLIYQKQIPLKIVDKKQIIEIDEEVFLEFLWPQKSLVNQSFKDNNPSSIVNKLIFGQVKFLFTGDIDKEVENEIIKLNENLEVDVLKVAHHGSKNSTSIDFLKKVRPKYGVISSGRGNKFGHPSFRVLYNLEKAGVEILRTDKMGDIIFTTDGNNLELIK